MSLIPKSLIEKYIPEELVKEKVDELFGEEFSVLLEVRRNGNDHDVTITVKNKDGEEIEPAIFDENDVMDVIHATAFVAEFCGILSENARITHKKASLAIQMAFLETHADEVAEALKNETENSNED
jgi:hypothetical protein